MQKDINTELKADSVVNKDNIEEVEVIIKEGV